MKGRIVYVGKRSRNGKDTWRVGLVPEGKSNAIFLNLDSVPEGLQKGQQVVYDREKKTLTVLEEKTPFPENNRPYINRSVALAQAVSLTAAELTAGIITLKENLDEVVITRARRFEKYLMEG